LTKYNKKYTNKEMSRDDNERRSIDSDVARAAEEELEAVEAGYGPYHQELLEDLGRLSLVGQEIGSLAEKLEQEKANLEFLQMVSGLLPKFVIDPERGAPRKPRFELSGPLAGYYYRQLQAHTLWNSSRDDGGLRAPARPYYVIGRALDVDPSRVSLLLLPAAYSEKTDPGDAWGSVAPATVKVRKDDLTIWDRLNASREGIELDEEERKATLDKKTAKLILDDRVRFKRVFIADGTLGCTNLTGNYEITTPSEKYVLKNGSVRADRYKAVIYPDGIPADVLVGHQMDTHLAKVASAFRVTEALHRALAREPEKPGPKVNDVLAQNHALRAALKQTILSTGLLNEEQVDQLILKRFPDLG
jgi:hypothetical protein